MTNRMTLVTGGGSGIGRTVDQVVGEGSPACQPMTADMPFVGRG